MDTSELIKLLEKQQAEIGAQIEKFAIREYNGENLDEFELMNLGGLKNQYAHYRELILALCEAEWIAIAEEK